jgi:hypothetical protein
VLAAAAAALGYRVLRGGEFPAVPYLIAGPTAALVALSGISLLWAKDLRAGTIELVFFYFPFSVLLSIVALTRTRDWTWRALATGLVTVTSVFAAIGVYQAWSHTDFGQSARTRRKLREWEVFNSLANGADAPEDVIPVEAPDDVHVIEHVRSTVLPEMTAKRGDFGARLIRQLTA